MAWGQRLNRWSLLTRRVSEYGATKEHMLRRKYRKVISLSSGESLEQAVRKSATICKQSVGSHAFANVAAKWLPGHA
jgi:hypothetical protein